MICGALLGHSLGILMEHSIGHPASVREVGGRLVGSGQPPFFVILALSGIVGRLDVPKSLDILSMASS